MMEDMGVWQGQSVMIAKHALEAHGFKDRHHLTVVGATSGDTGSAAIYGLRGKKDVSVFILHPKGRVSPIQEAQMTTVLDANVHNIAVSGTFDDCQV
jgi:threonine synthase